MEMLKRVKSLFILSLTVLLAGFSGQEKFVELEGYLNGRSSAKFRKIDTNIKAVLSTGTRGEILEKKKMASGNYGFRVKVLSGPYTGKTYWVYYNLKNPDLALYDSPPQTWDEVGRVQAPIQDAKGTETIRETQAIDDTDKVSEQAYQETQPKVDHDAVNAIDAIASGVQELSKIAVPSSRPECTDCTQAAPTNNFADSDYNDVDAVIGRSTKPMNPRCAAFMDRDGRLGRLGKKAMRIMSEPRYVDFFTKSNALGKFCPRFNALLPSEQLQAWTWFWAALANEETQCVQEIEHPTHIRRRGRLIRINDRPGWGFFALEKEASVRATRGRACRSVIGDGEGQMRCAIDIMKETTLADGQTASNDRRSYWGPVRRGNHQILPHMKRFKACF